MAHCTHRIDQKRAVDAVFYGEINFLLLLLKKTFYISFFWVQLLLFFNGKNISHHIWLNLRLSSVQFWINPSFLIHSLCFVVCFPAFINAEKVITQICTVHYSYIATYLAPNQYPTLTPKFKNAFIKIKMLRPCKREWKTQFMIPQS